MVSIIVESYLPEAYQKYQLQNFQMTSSYRSYSATVPEYMRGRPKRVILHCLDRMQKANRIPSTRVTIIDVNQGQFEVESESGVKRIVDFELPSCTCQDWHDFHMPCKHMFAIFQHQTQWTWDKLPQAYLQSQYMFCDADVLPGNLSEPKSQATDCQLEIHGSGDSLSGAPPECTSEIPKKVIQLYLSSTTHYT